MWFPCLDHRQYYAVDSNSKTQWLPARVAWHVYQRLAMQLLITSLFMPFINDVILAAETPIVPERPREVVLVPGSSTKDIAIDQLTQS